MTKKIKTLTILYGSVISYFGINTYWEVTKPKAINWSESKDQNKTIVIIGSGMAGLTVAYYLSNHPANKVIILERNKEPYSGTSRQNGNWLAIDSVKSMINKPLNPYVYNALFNWQEHVSKIYVSTAFESLRNFLIVAKFSYKWFFA